MGDRFLVGVDFQPLITLGPSEIEFGGQVFDCNRCQIGGGICCNTNPGCQPTCSECQKCACQGRGVIQCATNVFCNGICNVNAGCACNVLNTNNDIFGPRQTNKQMTCPEALALLDNPKQQNHVFNPNAIRAQCDPNTRLECCKGNANLGAALCGPFFGPTNFIGNCDSIMQSFCTTNPADPLCGCLKSDLPNPECIDVRCRNTNAMKLSNQLNNQCLGTFITCQQFFTLSPEARNNLVDGNTIAQTCNADQINPSAASVPVQGTPESSLGVSAIVGIVFGIVIAVVIIIVLAVLASEGKLSTKSKKKKSSSKKSSSSSSSKSKSSKSRSSSKKSK